MNGAWREEHNWPHIAAFLKMLAVCHTVLPEGGETPSTIKYQVGVKCNHPVFQTLSLLE